LHSFTFKALIFFQKINALNYLFSFLLYIFFSFILLFFYSFVCFETAFFRHFNKRKKTKIGRIKTKIGRIKTKIGRIKTKIGRIKTKIGRIKTKLRNKNKIKE
jgi:hypothetical protein